MSDSEAFYAIYDSSFDYKVPGQEAVLVTGGALYCLRQGGKAKFLTAYEDPTPFVEMAMKGQFAQH